MISRGEAMSPFDAPAPFFSEAMSPFDARALDFFGPLRGAVGGGPAASYSRGNREIAWMECIGDRF